MCYTIYLVEGAHNGYYFRVLSSSLLRHMHIVYNCICYTHAKHMQHYIAIAELIIYVAIVVCTQAYTCSYN